MEQVRFTHLRVGKGGVTVAFQHNQSKDFEGQKTIQAALAFCNPKDQFNKKRGRQIAGGRFGAGKTVEVEIGVDGETGELASISDSVAMFLMEEVNPMQIVLSQSLNDETFVPDWVQVAFAVELTKELRQQQIAKAQAQTQIQSNEGVPDTSDCCGQGCGCH